MSLRINDALRGLCQFVPGFTRVSVIFVMGFRLGLLHLGFKAFSR